jgi:hypothetical protein
MSKMNSYNPFGYLKHNLWPQEESRIKLPIWLAIWLLTIKSLKSPWFLFKKVACHMMLGSFDKGYNFSFDLISIKGLHTKLWYFKVVKASILLEFRDSHLGVPRQNDIWVLALWPGIENTTRWKVVVVPKFRSWWILWVCVCLWFVHAPKVFQLRTNQLVVWFLHVHANINVLVNLPSPHP